MNNGIAAVKKDGKAGYIDSTGKELCPFIFDETRTIQNNVAWVKYNGNWGILDAGIFTGNEPDIEAITASIEITSILFFSFPNIKLTANMYNPVTTNKYL